MGLEVTVVDNFETALAVLRFFSGDGPRSRRYGRIAALRLLVQTYNNNNNNNNASLLFFFLLLLFVLFQVVEHRWNETDRENPKYSGKNLCQCHFVHHKPHMA
jgi:hypothetical protein